MPKLVIAAILAAVLGPMMLAPAMAQAPRCEQEGRFRPICSLNNPEDLIRLEGTDWVLTSNMGDRTWSRGGFYIVSVKNRRPETLTPDFSAPAASPFSDCPRPDPALFSSHGLSVKPEGEKRFTVYAVNHGGRQSIEVFALDATGARPQLKWLGCAILPATLSANSVAALPDGGFVATVFSYGAGAEASRQPASQLANGVVLEWSPGRGWSSVPGSEVPGDNGIVASPDGKWLYINAYTEGALYKLWRGPGPYQRSRVQLNFLADNVRLSPKGLLLVTGHPATTFATIQNDCNGTAVVTCPAPTAVAAIDPDTLKAKLLLIEQNTANFGGGTSAIVVGDELWIGAFRAQRIATIPLAMLGSPDL